MVRLVNWGLAQLVRTLEVCVSLSEERDLSPISVKNDSNSYNNNNKIKNKKTKNKKWFGQGQPPLLGTTRNFTMNEIVTPSRTDCSKLTYTLMQKSLNLTLSSTLSLLNISSLPSIKGNLTPLVALSTSCYGNHSGLCYSTNSVSVF